MSASGKHVRQAKLWRSGAVLGAAALVALVLGPGALLANDPGHALAQKFADAAEPETIKKAVDKRHAAEEAEMLERARQEAAEREAAQKRAAAEAERSAEEERGAELERFLEEAEAKQRDEERRAEEAKRAETSREADNARRAEGDRLVMDALEKRLAAERAAKEAAEREAAERETAEKAAREAEERQARDAALREAAEARERYAAEIRKGEERRALEAEREAEAWRLTERLKRLEEARRGTEMELLGADPQPVPRDAQMPPEEVPGAARRGPEAQPVTRVTVLLIMEPGTTGIRRYGRKTADPVLCIGASCWVSAGPHKGAVEMTRGRALGPGNTLGRRAAACNQRLACIFRDVDIKHERAPLQPIDLRILRHDRRQELSVGADPSCDFTGGRLYCDASVIAKDWRAWIVPEPLAVRIGAQALEAALGAGLSSSRAAHLGDRVTR